MNILITGYTGFIGTNLTKELTGNTLYGLDIAENGTVQKHYSWDMLNACEKVECIIHLAGKAHDTQRTSSEKEYFEINTGLTKLIYDYFRNSDATKFIFLSSVKAVADTVKNQPLTEDTYPDPKTPYGRSKLAAEEYIINQEISTDKRYYILRPCMVHGPGNKGNLNLLYKFVKRGIPYPLGSFNNYRSILSVLNLAFIISDLLIKHVPSGVYNVADDEPLSTKALVKVISDSLNKNPRIWSLPKDLIYLSAKTGDMFGLPFNMETLKKLTETYIVSNLKIKSELGIEKLPYSAMEGIIKTFESF